MEPARTSLPPPAGADHGTLRVLSITHAQPARASADTSRRQVEHGPLNVNIADYAGNRERICGAWAAQHAPTPRYRAPACRAGGAGRGLLDGRALAGFAEERRSARPRHRLPCR